MSRLLLLCRTEYKSSFFSNSVLAYWGEEWDTPVPSLLYSTWLWFPFVTLILLFPIQLISLSLGLICTGFDTESEKLMLILTLLSQLWCGTNVQSSNSSLIAWRRHFIIFVICSTSPDQVYLSWSVSPTPFCKVPAFISCSSLPEE